MQKIHWKWKPQKETTEFKTHLTDLIVKPQLFGYLFVHCIRFDFSECILLKFLNYIIAISMYIYMYIVSAFVSLEG